MSALKPIKIKRSNTESHLNNKKGKKGNEVHNEESNGKPKLKDPMNKTESLFNRHLSWNHGIRLKNDLQQSFLKKQINQKLQLEKGLCGGEAQKQGKKISKLLEKIPDHRRIRSSSKISQKIIHLNQFFKADGIAKERVKSELYPSQSEENLENLLQLKLKTESNLEKVEHDLVSFRNTGYSKDSQISRFTFGIHVPLKSKLSDILSKNELNNSKQIIKENEELRKSKNLRPNPKQWQFHNCLVLQKIQLYSTNLKISCEGWVILDHLELKYLRGWNPKVQDDFSPLIRLFIARIGLELSEIAKFKLDMEKIFIRVNDKHIYEDQREKINERGQRLKGIAPHTILNLKQLITATTLTKHQDLVVHSVLAIGFILKLIHNREENDASDPLKSIKHQNSYHVFVKTTEISSLQDYCEKFERQCLEICDELSLPSTRVIVGFSCLYKDFRRKAKSKARGEIHEFTVNSSALDASILFMKCLASKDFREMLSHRVYETQVKHQVGWNFWQTRLVKWTNQEYIKYRLKAVGGRSNKGNQCFVVWDQHRDIVISMADCKVNMHWRDTERIQHWVQNHISRFSKHYCLNMTFFPTDTQKFHKIN